MAENAHKATSIYFELDEVPVKARPRGIAVFNEKTGKTSVRQYTPKETVEQEHRIGQKYCEASYAQYKRLVTAGKGVPVRLEVVVSRKLPQKRNAQEPDTTVPDVDNIVKAICDGLNAVAFNDDAQVTQLVAVKRNRRRAEVDHVSVRVTHLA